MIEERVIKYHFHIVKLTASVQPWEALIQVILESRCLERGKNEFATSIYTGVLGSQYSLGQTHAVICAQILKYTFTGHRFWKEQEKRQVDILKK